MEVKDEKSNESIQKVENSLNQVYLNKIEHYKRLAIRLKELFIFIKGSQIINEHKENILEYIIFPNLFPFDKLKEKIYKIFNSKNNKGIYDYLFGELKYLLKEDKHNKNGEEENNLRIHFYKVIESLNIFISKSLIFMEEENFRKEAFEMFKLIIQFNLESKLILSSYINVFNLYLILKDYYSINKEELLSIEGTKKILYVIDTLKLQNIISYKSIFNKKKSCFLKTKNLIFELFNIYGKSLSDLFNISNFLFQFKPNFLPSYVVEKILNDNKLIENNDNNLKCFIIENLMINYLINNNKNYKTKDVLLYFIIIINNNNILSKEYIIDWNVLNKLIGQCMTKKDYDKIINFLSKIKNNDVVSQHLKYEYIEDLIKSIPLEKLFLIPDIIRNYKDLIQYILINNNKKTGIKLIRAMKLIKNEYDEEYDNICMINFFYYKIYSCFDNSFDIFLDYALINQKTYNICFKLLIKFLYRNNLYQKNKEIDSDNIIELDENEENNNDNIEKINRDNPNGSMNNFLNYFKKNENLILNTVKEKILTLFYFAKKKVYDLDEHNKKLFDKELKELTIFNIDYNKYIPEDKYEPHDKSCIHINMNIQKIIFVDNAEILKENIKYFKRSKYIGIDSEWSTTSFNVNNKETASILQIANYNETTTLIIDLLKMKNDKEFFNVFKDNFNDKIFIGYAFNKSDIDQFFDELKIMFKYADIIDLVDLYRNKYMENAPSLKIMCEKILGQKICKYEQCSNWENRPLKKSQLHYAALDAIVCVSIFKVLNNYS